MKEFVYQIVLAGPNDDTQGWMNILFVVVLAVFWVISGIIKATAKKPQDGRKQPPLQKPVRKTLPPSLARRSSAVRPTGTAPARSQPRPRPSTLAARVEKAYRPERLEGAEKVESLSPKPPSESVLQGIPELGEKPLADLESMHPDILQRTPQAESLPEIVLDYTEPGELSKAILHYEILGPPVSLRNPSHPITGL
jgi:hypothetical protein